MEITFTEDWLNGSIPSPHLLRPITYARDSLSDLRKEQVKVLFEELNTAISAWGELHELELTSFIPVSSLPHNIKSDLDIEYDDGEVIDLADLFLHMIIVEQYDPAMILLKQYTWEHVMAVFTLAVSYLAAAHPDDSRYLIPALKASNDLSRNEIAQLHKNIARSIRQDKTRSAQKAAESKHANNRKLKQKARELYDLHKGTHKSLRSLSLYILEEVQRYGQNELDFYLRGGNPLRTVYDWVIEFNKNE